MNSTANDTSMHVEEGLMMYSTVQTVRSGFCGICFRDVPAVNKLSNVEFTEAGKLETYRVTTLFICSGCIARISSLDDAHNKGKELFSGVLQDRAM